MVRPTAPAFSVAPMTATALGRMKTSRSRLGASVRDGSKFYRSSVIIHYECLSNADNGTRRLPDDRVGVRPQPAQHSVFNTASDHEQIGIVVSAVVLTAKGTSSGITRYRGIQPQASLQGLILSLAPRTSSYFQS